MNDVSLLPGQEVDPCLYEDMSAYGMEPPKGLLECNGMVDGFITDCPEGNRLLRQGTPRRLRYRRFGKVLLSRTDPGGGPR